MKLSADVSQQHKLRFNRLLLQLEGAASCACWAAHLDADRQVAEEGRLNSMRDGAELEYRYVGDQHSVALCTLLGFHQVLDAQRHCLLVEAPEQLQNQRQPDSFLVSSGSWQATGDCGIKGHRWGFHKQDHYVMHGRQQVTAASAYDTVMSEPIACILRRAARHVHDAFRLRAVHEIFPVQGNLK